MKTLAVDKYQRVRLPDAKGGQRLAYVNHGNGSFTLTLVRAETQEAFPKGSLLKYVEEMNKEYAPMANAMRSLCKSPVAAVCERQIH